MAQDLPLALKALLTGMTMVLALQGVLAWVRLVAEQAAAQPVAAQVESAPEVVASHSAPVEEPAVVLVAALVAVQEVA